MFMSNFTKPEALFNAILHIVTVARKCLVSRDDTRQFWSRRELHFSLLDERLSILVATCCYEAPQVSNLTSIC